MSSKKDKNQNIQVFVRARPLNAAEKSRGSFSVMETSDHTVTLKERPQDKITKNFTFDRVFGPKSKQVDVYRKVVMPLLEQVLLGYNCTVFAYGQTGTGKTFTMEGERCKSELPWDQDPGLGIIPRTLSQLFDELRVQGVEFTVRVSFLELYNEELFDLLSPETDTTRLRLYEDAQKKGSCIIHGLEEVTVHNKNDVYEILRMGSQKRQTAATLMNAHSSRSHTVFSVTVHIKENTVDGEELLKTGKLNLVDLAGSENVGRSGAVDRRAREAGNINQSLLTLGRVITSLVERAPHVPYRESKLTRLLQDSLGGRTKTSIIAAVSPASCNLEETLSTLDYAQRAKNITNRPEINQKLSKKTLMKEYTEEIERLRRDLLATREQTGVYLAPENYNTMCGRLEEQEKEIVEKVNHIRALEEQMEKKEALFASLKTALEETEGKLCDTRCDLQKTKESLQLTEAERDEQSHLVERRAETERRLAGQASQLLSAVQGAATDLRGVHDKLDRKRSLEQRNDAVGRQFQAQFQTDMAGLESALEAAFQTQRAFCSRLDAGLGADAERRRQEVASLTGLLSSLLDSQTEQLGELETHCQSEAAGQTGWIDAQLAAVAARRQSQADTQTALQRQLAAGAEAVLGRLAQLDAGAEQRQAELRRWVQQHDAGLRDTLAELRQLVQQRERQQREEAEERAAALEEENRRLVDRQANLTGQIESLQASLSSIGAALAASSATADQLAAATAEDGAAAETALSGRRARLERAGRQEAEFHTAAGQRLERAHTRLAEDTAALDTLLTQTETELAQQTAEASSHLEQARDAWMPTLTELSAGWDAHCRLQEEALRARSEAINGGLQHTQKRVQNLAASLHGAVRGSDQLLESQSRGFFSTIRERQEELTDECARIETQAVAIGEMVRRRDNEVEVFVLDTLQRDTLADSTPRQRQLSYQRYRLSRAGRGRQSDQPAPEPNRTLAVGNSTDLLAAGAGDGAIKIPASSSNGTRLPDTLPEDPPPVRVSSTTSTAQSKGSGRAKHKDRFRSATTRQQRRRLRRARRQRQSHRTSHSRTGDVPPGRCPPCLTPPG